MLDFGALFSDNKMLMYIGLGLIIISVCAYFFMKSKAQTKESVPAFEPMQQHHHFQQQNHMAVDEQYQPASIDSAEFQQQQMQEMPLSDQPTVATCVLNESGQQVCG